MATSSFLLGCSIIVLSAFFCTTADVVEHTFVVHQMSVRRECEKRVVTVVNGSLPGPTIHAREGDTVVVHVVNRSPHNITIHWHGIFQLLTCWADGPGYINQCPIASGEAYTYRFNITGQEGTLWWHAHINWHRVTVHGPIVIRPRIGRSYPFTHPHREFPIVLGEWYNLSAVAMEEQLRITGNGPDLPLGFTVNGRLGGLDPPNCSSTRHRIRKALEKHQRPTLVLPSDESSLEPDIYTIKVTQGETYLLRVINSLLNSHMFFKVANHNMTVVAIDAVYTNPYPTDVVAISPGQTVDVLIKADQPPGSYHIAATCFHPHNDRYPKTPATAVLIYDGCSQPSLPIMPDLPSYDDISTFHRFSSSLTALETGPFWTPVPGKVDERMFMTVGLNMLPCDNRVKSVCDGPFNEKMAASLNNISFEIPTGKSSILEAYYRKDDDDEGIYTTDFPSEPPYSFNFTNPEFKYDFSKVWTQRATKVKKLKYNSTVEIILQSTSLMQEESHPLHLHGHNFYVIAQGLGNYDPANDPKKFNLINPPVRNTVAMPYGGWAVIRFQANNPGVWFMHCHIEAHAFLGLATVFIVEDGPTLSTKLPPPPTDLPQC